MHYSMLHEHEQGEHAQGQVVVVALTHMSGGGSQRRRVGDLVASRQLDFPQDFHLLSTPCACGAMMLC